MLVKICRGGYIQWIYIEEEHHVYNITYPKNRIIQLKYRT